jgi:hypothetical protein
VTIRRLKEGEYFSEVQITAYDEPADIAALTRRVASRRIFMTILAGLEQQFQDAPDDYAPRILKLVRIVRAKITGNNADQAARWAFTLGLLIRELELKIDFERATKAGDKVLKPLDDKRPRMNRARQQAAVKRHKQWQVWADEVWANSDLTNYRVAEIIIDRHGIDESVDTVRRYITKKVGMAG